MSHADPSRATPPSRRSSSPPTQGAGALLGGYPRGPLLATLAAATAMMGLALYAASCARVTPDRPPELGTFLNKLEAAAVPVTEPVALTRVVEAEPASPPERPAAVERGAGFAGTVEEATEEGCSTSVVRGLSEQIIEEINCLAPDTYRRVPELANLELQDAVFPYLAAPATVALVEALGAAREGAKLEVTSMLRTVAQQYLLYRWYNRKRCGITLAARPGKSNHQSGLAIDVSEPGRWRRSLERFGFRWLGKRDRWHFDYRKGRVDIPVGLDVKAFQRLWNRNHPEDVIGTDGGFGEETMSRLRNAPAAGFAVGARCDEPDR